jgi:hypothetical protein
MIPMILGFSALIGTGIGTTGLLVVAAVAKHSGYLG